MRKGVTTTPQRSSRCASRPRRSGAISTSLPTASRRRWRPPVRDRPRAPGGAVRRDRREQLGRTGGGRRRAASRGGRLTTAAVAILDEGGHRGAAQSDAVALALEAAAVDPDLGAELAGGTLEKLPTAGGDMGFGGVPAITALTGGADAAAAGGPSRAEAARLRRERDTTRAAAERRRAAADRLAHQLAEQRDALERLTARARRGRVGRAGGRARGGTGRAYRHTPGYDRG